MEIININDKVIVFNCIEWSKTGDLPCSNDKYYQPATVLNIREHNTEKIVDVIFDSGLISNGHFLSGVHKQLNN